MSEENPRILQTFNLKEGLKGLFCGESGEFKFVVECIQVNGTQYPEYKVMEAPAIYASINSFPMMKRKRLSFGNSSIMTFTMA